MPQPINYLGAIQNARPTQGLGELAQLIGQRNDRAIINDNRQLKLDALKQSQLKAQAKEDRKAAFKARFKELSDEGTYSDRKFDMFRGNFPEEIAAIDKMAKRFKFRSEENAKSLLTRVKMAARKGPEGLKVAAKLLEEYQSAHEGSGDKNASGAFADLKQSSLDGDAEAFIEDVNLIGGSVVSDWFKPSKEGADVKDIHSTIKERDAKTKKILTEEKGLVQKQAAELAKAAELPENVRKNYEKYNNEQATANADLNNIYAIMGNISGIDADDFKSGMVGQALSKFQTAISGEEWTKDPEKMALLRTQLAGITMSEAIKAKAAGSLSEGEMQELLKAVPPKGSKAGVYKKWLEARVKLIKSVSAREEIKKQFALKNRSELPANEKFTIDVGGKKITVNKGEDANKVISKIGTNVHKYAPEFGGAVDIEEAVVDNAGNNTSKFTAKTPSGSINFGSQEELDIFNAKVAAAEAGQQ